jgi:hypothetical protein
MMSSAKILRRAALMGLVSVVAAGCIFPSARDKALRRTPSFRAGYSDGCAAATAQGSNYREGPYRDEALYQSDEAYRAGWSNGFGTCRPAQPGNSPLPGASPIPSPIPNQ